MKLPNRLSVALGTLILGAETLSLEVKMSHPLHVACGLAGAFVLYLLAPPASSSSAPEIPAAVGQSAPPTPPAS